MHVGLRSNDAPMPRMTKKGQELFWLEKFKFRSFMFKKGHSEIWRKHLWKRWIRPCALGI